MICSLTFKSHSDNVYQIILKATVLIQYIVSYHQLVKRTVTSPSQSYNISLYFQHIVRYSYAGGKREHTYTELHFRNVSYTQYDVPLFAW
jgi:hypothetical protein